MLLHLPLRALALFVATLALPLAALALTIQTVTVGNPGNAPYTTIDQVPIAGAVADEFVIGKFEVNNSQYVEFLNAVDPAGANSRGLYNPQMTSDALGGINFSAAAANGSKFSVKSGRTSNPVVFVSFFDAARFSNWLHNGQGAADTESGSYLLQGGTAIPSNADFVARRPNATWSLPTFDEWYKAAYHKNDGVTGNYFSYPTSSDSAPSSDQPPGTSSPTPANTANFRLSDGLANGYNDGFAATGSNVQVAGTNYLTNVGAYTTADSPYGTFDQGGNVWEWTGDSPLLENRRVGGGAWLNDPSFLANGMGSATLAANETNTIGFRVVRVTAAALPGDYNQNGEVDAADYTIWRDTLGSFEDLRANGDDTGPSQGYIDEADYDFWKNAFASPIGSGASTTHPIPEPTTLLLLALSLVCPLPRPQHRLRLRDTQSAIRNPQSAIDFSPHSPSASK